MTTTSGIAVATFSQGFRRTPKHIKTEQKQNKKQRELNKLRLISSGKERWEKNGKKLPE